MSDAVALRLGALGVDRGDVISIQLPNWAELVVIHLAATRIGAINLSRSCRSRLAAQAASAAFR